MVLDRKNIILIILLFCCALVLLSWGFPLASNTVFAETTYTYSEVLDDLKRDSSFNESYYPVVRTDYSLQVIQIAESVNKELFIYVYQPSGQAKSLCASSINISTTINDSISFYNYKLQLLNSNGVFFKYLVKDFIVKTEPTRYYAITSIYRPFDESIDNRADYDNIITEVNYNVSKQYCFSIINGNPYVEVVDIETITITDKFVGFVRYRNGFELSPSSCDSHFVAFNTDKPIDKLLEADVYYTKQSASCSHGIGLSGEWHFGEKSDAYAYLEYTQKVEHTGSGLFAGTYKWDRIETVDDFLAENDIAQTVYSGALIDVRVANIITDEGKEALKDKKWILRFAETTYSFTGGSYSTSEFTTLVGDVTILRLKFVTDGVPYNLGTIDNKQTGSDKPINKEEIEVIASKSLKWLFALICLIILLLLFAPLLPYFIKLIVWVVSLPFKAIGTVCKSIGKVAKKNKGV